MYTKCHDIEMVLMKLALFRKAIYEDVWMDEFNLSDKDVICNKMDCKTDHPLSFNDILSTKCVNGIT